MTYKERIIRATAIYNQKIEQQKKNNIELADITSKRDKMILERKALSETSEYIVNLLNRIKQHEDEKKLAAYNVISAALKQVSKVIPDSLMANSELVVEDGKAYLVDAQSGKLATGIEGNGAKSVFALLVRYIITKNNPNLNNIIIMDEGLSFVSKDNIPKLREVLQIIAKDCVVVLVEQEKNIATDISTEVYRFQKEKVDGPTTITKVESNEEV